MAKRKTKSGRHQLNLAEELKDILDEYSQELFESKEQALDKAADFLVEKLEQNSPYDPNSEGQHLKDSWKRTDKYTGVRYVGNTKVTSQNIPLSNLVEFSKNGKPFIRRTFDENREEIVKIIKGEIENGNSK